MNPRTVITLHVAEPADRQVWVTQPHDAVVAAIDNARAAGTLVSFDRVRGTETVAFSTQPSNIANVEANL